MSVLTDRFTRAFEYCFELHRDHVKKGTRIPYVAHLMSVCALVLEDGGNEEQAIAALLHDALEDQGDKTSEDEIARRFGGRVRDLVIGCSDTPRGHRGPKPPWRGRKECYLEHLRKADLATLRIAVADKLHNARQILADYRMLGEGLWSRFNAGKVDQLWFYRSVVQAVRSRDASGFLVEELDRVVSELDGLATQTGSAT